MVVVPTKGVDDEKVNENGRRCLTVAADMSTVPPDTVNPLVKVAATCTMNFVASANHLPIIPNALDSRYGSEELAVVEVARYRAAVGVEVETNDVPLYATSWCALYAVAFVPPFSIGNVPVICDVRLIALVSTVHVPPEHVNDPKSALLISAGAMSVPRVDDNAPLVSVRPVPVRSVR